MNRLEILSAMAEIERDTYRIEKGRDLHENLKDRFRGGENQGIGSRLNFQHMRNII